MVRVIAGKYRRMVLEGPNDNAIRPTMDRAKEGLFNVINTNIEGADFLDLFAGSGGVAIEAISRGANNVTLVDKDQKSVNLIKKNLRKIDEEPNVIKSDVINFLNYETKTYDYIFLDPPYDLDLKIIEEIVDIIVKRKLLKKDGQLIFEYETKKGVEFDNINLVKFKKYGISGFSFYEV